MSGRGFLGLSMSEWQPLPESRYEDSRLKDGFGRKEKLFTTSIPRSGDKLLVRKI
jgi:hypothetical protein